MTTTEARSHLAALAAALPGLRAAEEAAAKVLSEAHLVLEAIETERWNDTGRGDLQAAIDAFREAERQHRAVAAMLEANWRESGRLRAALRRVEGER